MALIKALMVNMAISAVWYGLEWMQYKELLQRIINNCYIKPMPLPLH